MYEALGWTNVRGGSTCIEVPDGEQRCFRTTTVQGPDGTPYGPEQTFAMKQGCVQSGASCMTSPYQNPGNIWCCPPGWPRSPGAGPLRPGEAPPAPPGLQNKFTFYSQYWWFWAIALATPVVGYLAYGTLTNKELLGLSAGADLGVAGIEALNV